MSIPTKLGEQDITDATMYVLLETGSPMSTTSIKTGVRNLLQPTGINLSPLLNRNDEAIDQIIRNIVSHRDNSTNIINKGYVDYNNGMWTLTTAGKSYLHQRMQTRFTYELS